MDIGFSLNYTNLYMINITPGQATKTWARLGAGISTVDTDDSDTTSDSSYYDGEGMTSTDVTGVTIGYKFSGERDYSDPAQNYISSLRTKSGSSRITDFRHIDPRGEVLEGLAVISDISDNGGDATGKGNFEFGIHFYRQPTLTEPTATTMPESVTATAVTVSTGKTAQVVAQVSPTTAPSQCAYASSDTSIATVDADGTVHGVKDGTCQISVKSMVLPSVLASAKVTVSS